VALLAILISFGLVYLIIRITMRESFAERPYMHKPHFFEPLHLTLRLEGGDSRFVSLATYYLHEPHIG